MTEPEIHTRYAEIAAYVTKDGSEIRELMHPTLHGNLAQSLAEAIVHPGERTLLHRHHVTEEVYHITAGQGIMTLGQERFAVSAGDTICIAPGTAHCIENTATPENNALRILCICVPAYRHEDTELL